MQQPSGVIPIKGHKSQRSETLKVAMGIDLKKG